MGSTRLTGDVRLVAGVDARLGGLTIGDAGPPEGAAPLKKIYAIG